MPRLKDPEEFAGCPRFRERFLRADLGHPKVLPPDRVPCLPKPGKHGAPYIETAFSFQTCTSHVSFCGLKFLDHKIGCPIFRALCEKWGCFRTDLRVEYAKRRQIQGVAQRGQKKTVTAHTTPPGVLSPQREQLFGNIPLVRQRVAGTVWP